ncbi:MAG: hypothetical protein VYE22_20070 [Myxococcota bacterium]|nr:hypothetical protein [Myxococcota bacterium]
MSRDHDQSPPRESGIQMLRPRVPRPSEPRVRRRWEDHVSREEVVYLLEAGRYLDLLMRLEQARTRLPHDLELLRSVRVLQHHVRRRAATG